MHRQSARYGDSLQLGRHDLGGFLRRPHRNEFKFDQVPPVVRPFFQCGSIIAFHELEAAVEIRLDSAPDVPQALGRHSCHRGSAGRPGIAVFKVFDHHEEHTDSSDRERLVVTLVVPGRRGNRASLV